MKQHRSISGTSLYRLALRKSPQAQKLLQALTLMMTLNAVSCHCHPLTGKDKVASSEAAVCDRPLAEARVAQPSKAAVVALPSTVAMAARPSMVAMVAQPSMVVMAARPSTVGMAGTAECHVQWHVSARHWPHDDATCDIHSKR